jgi:Na+-translocating ferredoxin:NAD+ oxidoreductase subunit B
LADSIDSLLPQTQCTRCGYAACRPYAQALAQGEAQINRCPPGGREVIAALATLLGRRELPLDPGCGREQPATLAFIESASCIGCARCLPACPVDAILGAQHFLHSVLARECNGCELCVAACPVDCIVMQPRPPRHGAPDAPANRARFEGHLARDARTARERELLLGERKRAAQPLPQQ